MDHVDKYNPLFFTEESKESRDIKNTKFWQLLDNFDRKHPEAKLTVFFDVERDRFSNHFIEVLEFQCNLESEKQQVQAIYRDYYYPCPLTVIPALGREPTDEELHSV